MANKSMIKASFEVVIDELEKVKDKDTLKAVRAISDNSTRNTFLNVVTVKTEKVKQAIESSGQWDLEDLRDQVKELYDVLEEVNKVGGRVVGGIASEFEKLSVAQNPPNKPTGQTKKL